jgi:hypothetical protein
VNVNSLEHDGRTSLLDMIMRRMWFGFLLRALKNDLA